MNKLSKLLIASVFMVVSGFASATQGVCDTVESVWVDPAGAIFDLRKTINNENSTGQQYKATIPGTDLRVTCDLITIGELSGYTETSNCTVKVQGGPPEPFPIFLNYNFEVVNNQLYLDPLYLPAEVPPFTLNCVK